MAKKKSGKKRNPVYRFIRFMVWVFFPKYTLEGTENLPEEPAVLIGNHSKANGPIALQLYNPRESYTWCIAQMMHCKEVPAYAFEDFWSQKPKYTLWMYKLVSYLIAPLASFVMSHADTIGVYKDKRILRTFMESVERMQEGADIVIFPECYTEHNNIVHEFQRGFVELARLNYKKTQKSTPFVPMYVCPALKKLVFGKPVYYNAEADPKEEADRICMELMDAVSEMAYAQPRHKVVTYNNIRKKYYPENVREDEKEAL
ncbi:MAG: lysophospholipid acyltransferase family protein [Acetatifactor sp.]